MTGTMKAAICHGVGQPLVIEEVPIPEPTGREVLVRVKAASLCHSDIDILSGAYDGAFPLIMGHEAVGIVERLGPEAAAFDMRVGDLIGAAPFHAMCMACVDCRTAGPDFCRDTLMKGLSTAGYFAEYAVVDAATAVVVPVAAGADGDGSGAPPVPYNRLAPLFCAGITAWDALERASLGPGETVAVVGMGGLGQMVARYAHALGARVLALDIQDEQLRAARADGAVDAAFNTRALSGPALLDAIRRANGGLPVDHALVTSGAVAAYDTALAILKAQGQLVAIGLPLEPLSFHSFALAIRCIRITGAKVAGRECTKRCVDFSVRKNLLPKVNDRRFKLDDINEMISLMRAGKVDEGRMVINFS